MKKTVGVIFSGYGEQFVTMGKDIYNQSRHVQDLFEQASMCLDINFVQLCFAASDAEISSIEKGYLAILLTQISMYSQLVEIGLRPDFIAGFGIGEYAAAVTSGSLSFADGLYMLSKYAKIFKNFMEQYPHYAVLYIPKGFTQDSLQQLCHQLSTPEKQIFISAYLTEQSFYVAGHTDIIEQLKKYCTDHEIRKVKMLSAAYGLHSSIVDFIVAELSPYLFKIDFKPLKFPVITNVDGVYVTSQDALESALLRQINAPILFDEVLDGFVGCQVLICVGPGKQILQWAQAKYPNKQIYALEYAADAHIIVKALQDDALLDVENSTQEQIDFGACQVDDDIIPVPADLTIADEMNELPGDYDVEEEEEV
jgi:[acyl-carrier-protein] S-malonyltransferase